MAPPSSGASRSERAKIAPRASRLEAWLSGIWWSNSPGIFAWMLWPLSWLYRALADVSRRLAGVPAATAAPVLVVGNLVVGGAGKTPIVIALVQALVAAGRRPGVISRGHGRLDASANEIAPVSPSATPQQVGDEPLLIHRRTGVPVFVGRRRAEAAAALCAAHPHVDVIVSDDGLQHHALARVGELIVFDDRGAGNGLLLPAGPLRQALPSVLRHGSAVVYTGRRVSTPLAGTIVARSATHVFPLDAWRTGDATAAQPLAALRGRRLTALAGIGAPGQFFAALEAAGLEIERLACRDHAEYLQLPWPDGTREVITTEKDAVKLIALAPFATAVWVLPLDCELPPTLVRDLLALLPPAK